jgi:hypothetical protein
VGQLGLAKEGLSGDDSKLISLRRSGEPRMATPYLTSSVKTWIDQMACVLDPRTAWRLVPLLSGLLFATGRRTVSSWLRAGELSKQYQDYYYFVFALGRKVKALATVVLRIAVQVIVPNGRILLAIDDTPSKRYGPKVEGAGVHHNPTPGPAGSKFVYGHVWVTLAWVVRHPRWGTMGLPLLARLYVRQQDIAAQFLTVLHKVTFQTKAARIDYTPKESGTYLVVVTSFKAGETGPYTLRLQGYEPAFGSSRQGTDESLHRTTPALGRIRSGAALISLWLPVAGHRFAAGGGEGVPPRGRGDALGDGSHTAIAEANLDARWMGTGGAGPITGGSGARERARLKLEKGAGIGA